MNERGLLNLGQGISISFQKAKKYIVFVVFFRLSVCQKALEMYYYSRFMYVLNLVFSLIKVRADFMFTLNADILGENTVCGEYQDGDAPLRHRILRAQYT